VVSGIQTSLISAGALKSDGFEVNVTGRPASGLTLNTGIAYVNARYSGPYRFLCGPSYTRGIGACAANGTLSLDGAQAIGTPPWKVITSAVYEHGLSRNLKMTTRVAYDWTDAIQYSLYEDPVNTRDPAHGILNAAVAVGSSDDRWQLTLFVNNVTNKFYYSYLNTAPTTIGESYGTLPRDFERYGGIRLNYRL
jgi:iron complex outermembrane receptor protein